MLFLLIFGRYEGIVYVLFNFRVFVFIIVEIFFYNDICYRRFYILYSIRDDKVNFK